MQEELLFFLCNSSGSTPVPDGVGDGCMLQRIRKERKQTAIEVGLPKRGETLSQWKEELELERKVRRY